MRDNVAVLRRLLTDAFSAPSIDAEEKKVRRAFEYFEFNTAAGPVLDQSPRARMQREVMRIATWYSWGGEIERALDAAGAGSLGDLTMPQLEQLVGRMVRLEQCVQDGYDAPDAPPAR